MSRRSSAGIAAVLSVVVTLVASATPATAAPGDVDWSSVFAGPFGRFDGASALAVDPLGQRVYVTGESRGDGTGDDFATVAYDSETGEELWVSRYDGPKHFGDRASAIEVAPDGGAVYVTGSSMGGTDDSDWATVAYDAETGERLWARRMDLGDTGHDFPRDVEAAGSRVLVTGENGNDALTIAYDAAGGDIHWRARFSRGFGGDSHDVAVSHGIALIAGLQHTAGPSDYLVVAYRAWNGATIWTRTYDGPVGGYDSATRAAPSPDGTRLYVTGTSDGLGGLSEPTTIAYDTASGHREWTRRLPVEFGAQDDVPLVAVDSDGLRIAVSTADHPSQGAATFLTRVYDADGGVLWTASEDAPGQTGTPRGLSFAPDGGEVFVTGIGNDTAPPTSGSLTKAYAAGSGDPSWSVFTPKARRGDGATALGVAPDGSHVYVTGHRGRDYLSEAYLST